MKDILKYVIGLTIREEPWAWFRLTLTGDKDYITFLAPGFIMSVNRDKIPEYDITCPLKAATKIKLIGAPWLSR